MMKLGQTTYPVNGEKAGKEREGRDKFTKKRRRGKDGVEWGGAQWPLAREGRSVLGCL